MDPAQFFDARQLTHHSPRVRVWREGAAPGWSLVRLDQDIDDEGSVAWRGVVDAQMAEHGWARFMILDVHAVVATNSIAMRFKSAGWAKNVLQHLEQGAIFTGANHRSGFVIRAILRIAGMSNVTLIGTEDELRAAVDRYRQGKPIEGVPVRTI
ncbi:MAG: hypothetical protein Q8O67_21285 [Deltaproteobacteria bacterium]|nr:hypothetical protein [Deltaproteobacteria bacterium]